MTLFLLFIVLAIVSFVLAAVRVTSPVDFFPLGWAFVACAWAFGAGHI